MILMFDLMPATTSVLIDPKGDGWSLEEFVLSSILSSSFLVCMRGPRCSRLTVLLKKKLSKAE